MKNAYSVQADDAGCVIFAEHNVVARRMGAAELGCEFGEVESCRRAPEFDDYRDTEIVPASVMIEAGWHFECHHCGRTVTLHTEDPRYEGTEVVFCSESCQHAFAKEQVMERNLAQAAIDCACEKWPGIVPHHVSGFRNEPREVLFRFPGGQYSVNWTVGDDSLDVSVSDLPAWEAFTGKPAEKVCHPTP